ncbi:uncharacterized protein LOC116307364 [Actinia tenebrosa]|uniref:Uncharacterized protein LOC116307364 n=1 Tax=Actinia tenebrosa TaxID=6105 RepID=A0A6P8J942_ACTTE|nr:uncharacterized protein LOC116307364 [Actinia tenebrosa]
MESYGCSYSDVNVVRRSHYHNMLKQRTVVVKDPNAKAKRETAAVNDVDSGPMIVVEVQVKKEKTDDEHQSGIDVSRPKSFFYEAQTSLKGNSPRLPKDTNFAAVKEERRGNQSSSNDTKDTREVGGTEKDFHEIKESTQRRKTDVSRDGGKIHDATEMSSPNERKDSKQTNKKRKLYELHTEEHSLRNDFREFHPTSHARPLEAPIWHQAKEGERKMPQDANNIAYTQFNKTYADPYPTYERIGIHEMPSDYRVVAGSGCKLGPRPNNEQVHRNSAYLPSIDPRNRKCFITEEPSARYVPDEQAYRSLQEERLPRWHPKYGVLFANPNRSECYSKNEPKSFKQSEEDGGFQSKERFEHHYPYRLQADSNWPYFNRIAGKDDVYDKQRIAFLRVEHPGAERNNQTKAFDAFSTEQHPGNRPSTGEYVRYLPVPNMLIPTPKPEFLFNGLSNVPFDIRRPFPVTDNGSLAFIEKEKVFYPCCNEEIPLIHYNNVTSNARWLDTRNERQRFDEFQASKSEVPFTNQTQTMILDDAGARIIHMNDLGYKQKRSRGQRERFKDVPLPVHATVMEDEFSKKDFPTEETITAENHIRRIDKDRRKDKIFSSYSAHNSERKANGDETPTAWKDKVDESRSSKEILEGKKCDTTKEERNEKSGESGSKLIAVSQVKKEKTKALEDPKNSETQPKISLDQAAENQDDSNSKKAIICSVCKKTFNRTSNLYTHMRTHSANKPHACEFCGKRFHQKADLRIHRYIHTGEKPHKCAKCGRGFKQLTHLKYHMRTHSDVRMYKCQYCDKGFNQKSNLQAHIFGHTGQRPHKCETCGKGFTLASTLNTHKRIHLPNKPFKCEFCDRAFYQKNALKMHYVSTHPYSSGVCLV